MLKALGYAISRGFFYYARSYLKISLSSQN